MHKRFKPLTWNVSVQKTPPKPSHAGGAALEYLLVSLFAACLSMACLGMVAKIANKKIHTMMEKADPEMEPVDLTFQLDGLEP
jgi:hypothetical protein